MHVKSKYIITTFLIIIMVSSIISLPQINGDNKVEASSKYKVTFKATGGKFVTEQYAKKKSYSEYIIKGKKIGELPKVTKKGHKFKGWFTKKTAGKKIKTTTKIKKKTSLYARWAPKSYQVLFDFGPPIATDEGHLISSAESKMIKYGKKFGELPEPDRTDLVFVGWFTKKKGGKQIYPTTVFKYTKQIELHAHYKKI